MNDGMIDIREIMEGLDKDPDFVNSQRLFSFFKGEETSPFKHRTLDTEKDFSQILFRETGVIEGWNSATLRLIKVDVATMLEGLVKCTNKKLFDRAFANRYVSLTNSFLNWLDDPKVEAGLRDTRKVTASHHVLAYVFDCIATGCPLPIGEKKKLEAIGSTRIGQGKGNRFYKVFGEMTGIDFNSLSELVKYGGDDWRSIVLELACYPKEVEEYLRSKQL